MWSFSIVRRLLRVQQYVKNFFVFIPAFFGGKLVLASELADLFLYFLVFCGISSVIYIINDITDQEEDRRHPLKRSRPLAAGEVSVRSAALLAVGIALACVIFALLLFKPAENMVLAAYAVLNILYTFLLKQFAIIDISCIAAGFVLRAVGGTLVADLHLSQWLVLMVFLLCMFLALGKRWDDLRIENSEGGKPVRKSISGYTQYFVHSALTFFATINTICYIMYTLSPQAQQYYGTSLVYLSSFWVILGNMRYLQIIFVLHKSGAPTKILMQDLVMQGIIACWILHMAVLVYHNIF